MEESTNQKFVELIKKIKSRSAFSSSDEASSLLIEASELIILMDQDYINSNDVLSQKMIFDKLSKDADINLSHHGDIGLLFFNWVSRSPNVFAKAYKLGFRHSWKLNGIENARRATNGRRLIGATTRESVKREAAKHMHLKKGPAAYEIASKINLSPDRVRKLLSELFPGDSWVASSD